jgi:hypothetical protein
MKSTLKMMIPAGLFLSSLAIVPTVLAQYQVITVGDGGTITGTVKWTGTKPQPVVLPITKNPDVCAPQGQKTRDLERIIIAPDGAVENTLVYLKGISKGKAMDLPQARRSLDQKNCRYIPHILLVPKGNDLTMVSSDPILHNIHMTGVQLYNLPFPIANHPVKRPFQRDGETDLKCDAGHVWMNSVAMTVDNPYYAITDEHGNFKLTDVPPGTYTIEAWHESWHIARQESMMDVDSHQMVTRPIFAEGLTWDKSVTVPAKGNVSVDFQLAEK